MGLPIFPSFNKNMKKLPAMHPNSIANGSYPKKKQTYPVKAIVEHIKLGKMHIKARKDSKRSRQNLSPN